MYNHYFLQAALPDDENSPFSKLKAGTKLVSCRYCKGG